MLTTNRSRSARQWREKCRLRRVPGHLGVGQRGFCRHRHRHYGGLSCEIAADAGCGRDERIVRLPRKLLVNAKGDIPNSV